MKKALVPVADGTEEIEAVIIVDVLRRAGWQVVVAGIGHKEAITASRGVWKGDDWLFFEVCSILTRNDKLKRHSLLLSGTKNLCHFNFSPSRLFDVRKRCLDGLF